MGFLTISKFLMIISLPFLILLLALNFFAFGNSFYAKEFSEYKVYDNVPQALSLHGKVMDFISGKSDEIPVNFNEREKQHLLDVRNVIRISTIVLYIFIVLFILLLVVSSFILKANNYIINFVGKVLLFGGVLTVVLTAILFFFISSDFSAAFESFHQLFLERGTYLFDPAKEIIVKLYPEQLFMDLGARISKTVILTSTIIILVGIFLIFKSKSKKNKKNKKPH